MVHILEHHYVDYTMTKINFRLFVCLRTITLYKIPYIRKGHKDGRREKGYNAKGRVYFWNKGISVWTSTCNSMEYTYEYLRSSPVRQLQ
jgi:hypothetical protein